MFFLFALFSAIQHWFANIYYPYMTTSPGAENLRCHPLWGTVATLYLLRLVIACYLLASCIPSAIVAPPLCKKKCLELAKMSKNLRKKGKNYTMLLTKAIRTFSINVVYRSFKSAFCIFLWIEPFIVMPLSVMNTIKAPGHD